MTHRYEFLLAALAFFAIAALVSLDLTPYGSNMDAFISLMFGWSFVAGYVIQARMDAAEKRAEVLEGGSE